MRKIASIIYFLFIALAEARTQCSSGIIIFPYNDGFEASDGGWISGGVGNDWAWGTSFKLVISVASGGRFFCSYFDSKAEGLSDLFSIL